MNPQVTSKELSKSSKNRSWSSLGPSWGRFGSRMGANRVRACHFAAFWRPLEPSWIVLGRKRCPRWLQVGRPNGATIYKNSKQKSFILLDASGFFWGGILLVVGKQNVPKLVSESHPKSIPTSIGYFCFFFDFSLRKTMILKVPGVEVGIKNESKINQNMKPALKGLVTSIFNGFRSI